MNFLKQQWKLLLVLLLILSNIFIWYAITRETREGKMTVAFLNIGQGDAIFIESPTGNQIVIDGGPSRAILGELRKVMPFYDRTLDALVVTNPDKDHFAGFINVLDLYEVPTIIEPGTLSDTDTYNLFEQDMAKKNIGRLIARRGMTIHLGGGAELRILYPDHDVSGEKTNDGSIIAQLVYGTSEVMLTGDAPNKTEEYVTRLDGMRLKSDILKAGHHGSRTSASELFVTAVAPQYAVISAAKKNSYGHPHKETLSLFFKQRIPVLGTYEKGTIVFICDAVRCDMKK